EDGDLPLDQRARTAGGTPPARLREPGGAVELVGGQFGRAGQSQEANPAGPTGVQDCPDQAFADATPSKAWIRGDLVNGRGPVAAFVKADKAHDARAELGGQELVPFAAFEIRLPGVESEFVAVRVREALHRIYRPVTVSGDDLEHRHKPVPACGGR